MQTVIVVCVLLLAMTGCCATPETIIDVQKVYVPVFEPCDVHVPHVRRYETEELRRGDADFEKIKAILIERQQRMRTEEELRLLLDACTAPLNQPLD